MGFTISTQAFLDLLDRMWETWITEMEKESRAETHFLLGTGRYLADILEAPSLKAFL